jgi:23S rRNA (adenine2030-N6)-methyltransferase
LNYRHIYHAGNFADVFKHAVLVVLLRALAARDKPFCYIETHAGAGRYDLDSEPARKGGEWREGIGRLWDGDVPAGLADYLAQVRAANGNESRLRYYPGSPRIARGLLRTQDRIVLCECVDDEAARLRAEFAADDRVGVRTGDGYAALKGLLPPPERRGLVFIDPPYERESEFTQALAALRAAHARWPSGVYALWYPIKERAALARFEREVVASGMRRILLASLNAFPADSGFRLNGSGVLIVNPPWRIDEELRRLCPALADRLGRSPDSAWRVDWLVPE